MIVIFGASGKVGRATAAALRSSGHAVRAVVRNAQQGSGLMQLGCEMAIADLLDEASVASAMRGADAVQILCPVPIADAHPANTMHRMIDVTVAALRANLPARVLTLSDYGAELESGTGITMLFHALEMQLKPAVQNLTLLRAAEHMQNWARVLPAALSTGILPSLHHPLSKRFPTVAAQDVGRVAAELLLDSGHANALRTVSVEGPQRVSALDVARTLSELSGREIAAHALPRDAWAPTLLRAGLSAEHAKLITDLYDTHNAGLIDAQAFGERRFGTTQLSEVLASMLPSNATAER
ncbi:NAD(P)H-binding protein [Caballeronia sp. DA-9]|uniref:NAD(P)H-binding protein n=1 Tax=Caballeronia sp. DA-9 TaxID=3436237 RepID=UPI003F66AB44